VVAERKPTASDDQNIVRSTGSQHLGSSATISHPAGLAVLRHLALPGIPIEQAFDHLNRLAPNVPHAPVHMLSMPLTRLCDQIIRAHEEACRHGQALLSSAWVSYFEAIRSQHPEEPVRHGDAALHERALEQTAAARLGEIRLLTSKPLPVWDCKSRRLWLGDLLVKQFRQPSPNQTAILDVFEEEGWENFHIDDPLPIAVDETQEDAKRRLHHTIHNLNRNLLANTIRFHGDGTGQGVIWAHRECAPA
jgi:hypothetical protein